MANTVDLELLLGDGWQAVLAASGADKTGIMSSKGNIEIAFGTALPETGGHTLPVDVYSYTIPDGQTLYARSTRRVSVLVYTED